MDRRRFLRMSAGAAVGVTGLSALDADALVAASREKNAAMVVVTEKDAVKLQALKLPPSPAILALSVKFEIGEPSDLWERISKALSAGDARLNQAK